MRQEAAAGGKILATPSPNGIPFAGSALSEGAMRACPLDFLAAEPNKYELAFPASVAAFCDALPPGSTMRGATPADELEAACHGKA